MRYSLGLILALSLAGLQFLAVIVVVLTTYVSSQQAILEHARDLMEDAGTHAAEHTNRFLEPAGQITAQASRVLSSNLISATDTAELEHYLFELIKTVPQISGINYGDEAGNFTYIMKSKGVAPYRSKIITTQNATRIVEFIWRNSDFTVVQRSFDPDDTYDPRPRPWYIQASKLGQQVWTDPYIFFSSQQPGVTVSAPVMAADGQLRGVVSIDLDIANISRFLSDLVIGETGAAFILSDDGQVIAHPDPAKITMQSNDSTMGFIDVNDFSDPVVRAAFAGIDINTPSQDAIIQSQFTFADDRYMTSLLPIAGIDLPWKIAVFAPENDFTQGIKDNRRRNIWMAVVISLLTAIVGITLAELILRPVRAFAVRTALVSQGEVAPTTPLPRTYKELRKANQTLINEIAQRRTSDAKAQDLSRQLSHSSRINMMGQMATGLAHELSQPLTAITQNLDTAITLAKSETPPNTELLAILNELDEQAYQGGDIIHALRGFIRKDEGRSGPFDLKELILQTSRLMRTEADSAGITIITQIPDLPFAVGNRIQIAQALVNLMRNAVDAMVNAHSPIKTITITAAHKASILEVTVDDKGPGVAPDVLLFTQFQTSKTDGLGLGLSISRNMIEANGGRLWHDTQTKQTRFCFTVPAKIG